MFDIFLLIGSIDKFICEIYGVEYFGDLILQNVDNMMLIFACEKYI
jgi:hypothetical protein